MKAANPTAAVSPNPVSSARPRGFWDWPSEDFSMGHLSAGQVTGLNPNHPRVANSASTRWA